MRAERFHTSVVVALAGLVVIIHVLGATAFRTTLWGAHFYAFLPPWALPVALTVTLVGVVAAWRFGERAAFEGPATAARPAPVRVAAVLALGALSFAILWWLRIRHTLLGDSGPLSHNLPLGERSHHLQPLSLLLHHYAYEWTHAWFAKPGALPDQAAFDAVALDSVIAGAIFVPVAFALARELVRPASATSPGASDAPPRGLVVVAGALVLTQGFIQIFCGYVENYTWFALMMALYLWAGLAFLRGRAPLIAASLPLIVGIGLNLSGVVLLPSLGLLVLWGLFQPGRRLGVLRDLGLTVAGLVAMHLVLGTLGRYDTMVALRYMWDLVAKGQAMQDRSLLSAAHTRDIFAVHVLIGPFAGLLLIPVALHRVLAGTRSAFRDNGLLFVLGAALPPLVASWTYGDSIQGLPRDWDLFAPFALLYVAAAIYCMASEPLRAATLSRLFAVATVVSLFHTGAWVMLNRSELRSLERYKTVPATRGRTEMVVGFWYLNHGDTKQAREWFMRSVAVYPANNASQYELGLFAMDEGHYSEAALRFWIATQSRPDKPNYRIALVDAMVLDGHPEAAVPHLETLEREHPDRPQYWACSGIVLAGIGRIPEARAALERAVALAPADRLIAALLRDVANDGFYERAVAKDWDALVLR